MPSAIYTPPASRRDRDRDRDRALSPPLSASSSQAQTATVLNGLQHQKLNVVTRVAIEGRAKQDQDGAAVKMYLKISLPLDSVVPGQTISLFPEENIKILKSQVHPIDNASVPYNFSSSASPLLHNAARALNLPARSPHSYLALFGLPAHRSTASAIAASSMSRASSTMSRVGSTNGSAAELPPLDERYTGYIVVSGYQIAYVLPREFPPRDAEDELYREPPSASAYKNRRRSSFADKPVLQFMAAIDMWVPYLSTPPKAPYLLSIPVPRCLSNHVRLRIFPPPAPQVSSSFASLSSADSEDAPAWELAADPHVTRTAPRRPAVRPYADSADDESSDTAAAAASGFDATGGCALQGTFPSTERLRVRWAPPPRPGPLLPGGAADARRRAGAAASEGTLACAVLGRAGANGVVLRVEYVGAARGVWFPGVATLLGLDVALVAGGCDVGWAPGAEGWTVGGGAGYMGFDVAAPPEEVAPSQGTSNGSSREMSQQSSMDTPQVNGNYVLPLLGDSGAPLRRNSTASSAASLLRAPLPSHPDVEYSFEGSQTSSALSATVSSFSSLPPSTPLSRQPSMNGGALADGTIRPPGAPVTIHVNINDLLPPNKNVFTFTIAGTIVVTPRRRSPRSSPSSDDGAGGVPHARTPPVPLPRFTVFAAAEEALATTLRNDAGGTALEVYTPAGDVRDAQTRRTVLRHGGATRCGAEGARIALRDDGRNAGGEGEHGTPGCRAANGVDASLNGNARLSRAPSGASLKTPLKTVPTPRRPQRDGPLIIPSVCVAITPLLTPAPPRPSGAHAVRVSFPAPADAEAEWLEFGLPRPLGKGKWRVPLGVDIASVSLDGVPVRFEAAASSVRGKEDAGAGLGGMPLGDDGGREWLMWVRVHVGEDGGGEIVIDYVVHDEDAEGSLSEKQRGKRRATEQGEVQVLLPTFLLPVGRLEVVAEAPFAFVISALRSNLAHEQTVLTGRRLLHFSLEELFHPHLTLEFRSAPPPLRKSTLSKSLRMLASTIPSLLCLTLLFCLLNLGMELQQLKDTVDGCTAALSSDWEREPVTVTATVTSTVYTPAPGKWWFGETGAPGGDPSGTWDTLVSPTSSPAPTIVVPTRLPRSILPPAMPADGAGAGALVPLERIHTLWAALFNFTVPAMPRVTVDTVLDGLGKVWRVVQRIYHYPLPP